MPFIAVTEKAASHLVNEHYAVLQRALSAHERLERIVLSERGLDGVADALASLIGGPALIFDARGDELVRRTHRQRARRRHGRGAARRAARAASATAPAAATRRAASSRAARWRCRWCARPPNGTAQPGDLPHAWLVAAKDGGALTEFDRLTLHQAVTIVALELLRRRVADDTERRLAGDLLTALVSGELTGPDLARRLEPFGLGDRVGVLVLQPPRAIEGRGRGGADHRGARRGAGRPRGRHRPVLVRAAPARARRRRTRRSGSPSGSARASRARSAPSCRPARAARRRRATCGARSTRRAARSRRGRWRATSGSNGSGPPLLATYRDLGSFQLLLSLQDDDALRLFCDSILSPIEEGEGAYGGELMRSLESFIECNGQWEKAARQLYCHRHTLRYRIRRVEELTGRSLDSARDRIDFWLALRGRELIT